MISKLFFLLACTLPSHTFSRTKSSHLAVQMTRGLCCAQRKLFGSQVVVRARAVQLSTIQSSAGATSSTDSVAGSLTKFVAQIASKNIIFLLQNQNNKNFLVQYATSCQALFQHLLYLDFSQCQLTIYLDGKRSLNVLDASPNNLPGW